MTLGINPFVVILSFARELFLFLVVSVADLITSRALALFTSRLMNQRSSNADTKRCIPDLDFKFNAVFISSKDGQT